MGDAQAFEDIVYGPPTNNLANYIGASMRALGSYITDRSRDFFSNANRVYQQFTGEQARHRIYKNILNNHETYRTIWTRTQRTSPTRRKRTIRTTCCRESCT